MQIRLADKPFADGLSHRRGTLCHHLAYALVALLAAVIGTTTAAAAPIAPERAANGVYWLRGAGGEIDAGNGGRIANVAFVVGTRGVAVIDSGVSYREGEDIIAAVRSVSEQPIRLVILTHPSQEVVFGAGAFQDRGIAVLAHRASAELIASRCDACLARLRQALGEDAMASTRVPKVDRMIESDEIIDTIGRRLRVIATGASSAPGAIAVLDEQTSTLMAGSLVSVRRVPDLRDADVAGWRAAFATLRATRCARLIPAYGPLGTCADIEPFARYFDALDTRVRELLRERVGLVDLAQRAQLPQFADWDQYAVLHPANANRTYLRLERQAFD